MRPNWGGMPPPLLDWTFALRPGRRLDPEVTGQTCPFDPFFAV